MSTQPLLEEQLHSGTVFTVDGEKVAETIEGANTDRI